MMSHLLQASPATVPDAPQGVHCVSARLAAPLQPSGTVVLRAYGTRINALHPHPAQVHQMDPQLVLFTDVIYPISPYEVAECSTKAR